MTVHEKGRPFKCEICQRYYGRKGVLNTHQRTVHENKRPFNCGICQGCFGLKTDLKRHQRTVHENKRPLSKTELCLNWEPFKFKNDLNLIKELLLNLTV